jgi:hypothetical protein
MSAASAPDIALVVLNNSSVLALLWRMQNDPAPFTLAQIATRRVALQEATWPDGFLAICSMQWLRCSDCKNSSVNDGDTDYHFKKQLTEILGDRGSELPFCTECRTIYAWSVKDDPNS